MLISDHHQAPPRGHFRLEISRRGKLIEVYEDPNLIVDNYKLIHARLLGGDVADRSVTQIGFGINGTVPAPGNTSLTDPFLKAVDAVVYPQTNQVRFDFSLGTAEANGKAILEFGLLTAAGMLYARKTRSAALNKEVDISLSGSWLITF